MSFHPAEFVFRQCKRLGVVRGLISRRCSVQGKTFTIHFFAVAEGISDLSVVVESPEKAAEFFVPKNIIEEVHSVLGDGKIFVFEFWTLHRNLGCDPGHASLKHGELALAGLALPLARKCRVKAAIFVVNRARKPDIEHIAVEHGISIVGDLQVSFAGGRGVGSLRRFFGSSPTPCPT